ncbi:uncharacterized protein LOC144439212 [Glandiceps talaboti]
MVVKCDQGQAFTMAICDDVENNSVAKLRKLYDDVQRAIPSYGEGSDDDDDDDECMPEITMGVSQQQTDKTEALPVLYGFPTQPTTPSMGRHPLDENLEQCKPKLPPKNAAVRSKVTRKDDNPTSFSLINETRGTEEDYYLMPVEEVGGVKQKPHRNWLSEDSTEFDRLGDPQSSITSSSTAFGLPCGLDGPPPERRHTYDSLPQSPPKVPERSRKPHYGYGGSIDSNDYLPDDMPFQKLARRYKQHVVNRSNDKIVVSDNEHMKLTAKPYLPRAGQKLLFTCKVHHEYAITVRNITWSKRVSGDKPEEFKFQGYQCELPFITRRHTGEYECFVHAVQSNGNDLTFSGSIYIDVISDDSEVVEESIPRTPPRDSKPISNPTKCIRRPRLDIQLGSLGLKAVYDKEEIKVAVEPYPLIEGQHKRVTITCKAKDFQAKDIVYYFGNLANEIDSKQLRGSICTLPPFKKQDGGHYKIAVTRSHDNYQIYETIYIPVYESLKETGLLKECNLKVKHMLDEIDLMDDICQSLDVEQPLNKNWQHLASYLLSLSDQQLCTIKTKSGSPTKAVFRKIKASSPNMTCAELLQCLQEEMSRNDVIIDIAKHHEQCLACHYFYYNV